MLVLQEHLVCCHVSHVFGLLRADGGWLHEMRDVSRHGRLLLHLGNHEPLLWRHLHMLSKCLLLQVCLCGLVTLVMLFCDLSNLGGPRTQRGLVAGTQRRGFALVGAAGLVVVVVVMVIVMVVVVLESHFLVLKLNYYRLVDDYLRIRDHGLPLLVRVVLSTVGVFRRLFLGHALRLRVQGRVVRRSVDGRALGER